MPPKLVLLSQQIIQLLAILVTIFKEKTNFEETTIHNMLIFNNCIIIERGLEVVDSKAVCSLYFPREILVFYHIFIELTCPGFKHFFIATSVECDTIFHEKKR